MKGVPNKSKKTRAAKILIRLRQNYVKKSNDFILWKTPLELLIGTVLSAQCTDKKVNQVTQTLLFHKYPSATDYAAADLPTLEQEIFSLGFYRVKARYLKGIGTILTSQFNGKVPNTVEKLLTLPGVSYKTAYLIMAKGFGQNMGIAVDTHVKRLAPRLGLTSEINNIEKIGRDLQSLYQPKDYLDVNEYLILHG